MNRDSFFSREVADDLGKFFDRKPDEPPLTLGDEPVGQPDSLDPRDTDVVLADFAHADFDGELFSVFYAAHVNVYVPLGMIRARNRSIARTLARVQWKYVDTDRFLCLTRAETIVALRDGAFNSKPL